MSSLLLPDCESWLIEIPEQAAGIRLLSDLDVGCMGRMFVIEEALEGEIIWHHDHKQPNDLMVDL